MAVLPPHSRCSFTKDAEILAGSPTAVIVNGLVIGWVLHVVEGLPYWLTVGTVTLGQVAACYGLGYPLLLVLQKYKHKIFGTDS